MKDFEGDVRESILELKEYRLYHCDSDWNDAKEKSTTIESYGLFNLCKRSVLDKEKMYSILKDKHRYWVRPFGRFDDHWGYNRTLSNLEGNPYLHILPIPGIELLNYKG